MAIFLTIVITLSIVGFFVYAIVTHETPEPEYHEYHLITTQGDTVMTFVGRCINISGLGTYTYTFATVEGEVIKWKGNYIRSSDGQD